MVSGRDDILKALPRLQALAERSGQAALPDDMAHFLDKHYVGAKSPHLLMFPPGRGESVTGAVLMHQYRLAGLPLRLFVTEDVDGERNVLSAPDLRSHMAMQAVSYLMRMRRAHLALVSLKDGDFAATVPAEQTRRMWANMTRTSRRYLVMGADNEDTLAHLGAHTRRNLRSAARKAERELGCVFHPQAELSREDFLQWNLRSAYPVSNEIARWRYGCTKSADAVTLGVRTRDGRWLSLLGGRRSHGTLAVDWQMNAKELHAYSPSTVLRTHMIRHEHELGTTQIRFEGGTPHTMSESLRADAVTDLVAVSGQLTLRILQQKIAPRLPQYNVLRRTLEQELHWHPQMGAAVGRRD